MVKERFVHYVLNNSEIDNAHLTLLINISNLTTELKQNTKYYFGFDEKILNQIKILRILFEKEFEIESPK